MSRTFRESTYLEEVATMKYTLHWCLSESTHQKIIILISYFIRFLFRWNSWNHFYWRINETVIRETGTSSFIWLCDVRMCITSKFRNLVQSESAWRTFFFGNCNLQFCLYERIDKRAFHLSQFIFHKDIDLSLFLFLFFIFFEMIESSEVLAFNTTIWL